MKHLKTSIILVVLNIFFTINLIAQPTVTLSRNNVTIADTAI